MNKDSAGFGRPNNKARRNIQNQRTFRNVQKRRSIHAKNHGMSVADIPAKRWVTVPTASK